ncbi:cytochrome P450 [Paractinoplanes abujensis]|uniref:Cytochrome P450 n=1 Tax=Paractinoplanes abujensis TaxID=882441 RepID=A0A7W7G157_9ACTN|nr:cytochrome P450 [Actinoplanes abujensis]MBB4693803.1 cytochrome P450 [Actinoplanes abujensis]GID21541.1 cytochrome P450 [Actinoplanes abujensis]
MDVVLPDGPSSPRLVQVLQFAASRRGTLRRLRDRYGSAFTVQSLNLGRTVMLSDPQEVRELLQAAPELADTPDANLGSVLGPGSMFAIAGEEHRRQRKLLTPPFHGRRLRAYEGIVEEETRRETASWPIGREFPVMPSTMRITLNVILRAVFGADGAELDELRVLLPQAVKLGSVLAVVPALRLDLGGRGPGARFARHRRRYDEIVDVLVDRAQADPRLAERDDVLAMLVQSRYDDGSAMSRGQIADQLLTLLAAGHETTATTLAWAVERLRRHPEVLARLAGAGDDLFDATITEVQRVRPVIEMTSRQVRAESLRIGRWTLPRGTVVTASIALLHDDATLFPEPERFDPDRYAGARADTYGWIPFGGGVRRCLGAAFASLEMRVVLRTILRDFVLEPATGAPERSHNRGIAVAPARGGLAVVRRR